MDIDALKAFVTVANCRSFSLAAQQLFLTQPAVSKRVAALERHLNHRLFNRLGKDVTLTEAGQILLVDAEGLLQQMRDTERKIRERSGEIIGTLRVATSHHIGLHHLPPVLRTFASQHPDVNLQFEFLDSELAFDRVIAGHCELAVVTLGPTFAKPLVTRVLWPDPLVFVVSRTHPLSNIDDPTLATLSGSPALLPDLTTFTGRLVKECFDDVALPLHLNMATNYLETIKMMVSVGLGWSVLPRTLVDDNMTELNIAGVNLSRQLGVIYHEKRQFGNAARAFFDVLTSTL